jgi:hypothetical protein
MNHVVFIISNSDVVWGMLVRSSTRKCTSRRVGHVGVGLQPHSIVCVQVVSGRDCGLPEVFSTCEYTLEYVEWVGVRYGGELLDPQPHQ